jgi:hypothetical protein
MARNTAPRSLIAKLPYSLIVRFGRRGRLVRPCGNGAGKLPPTPINPTVGMRELGGRNKMRIVHVTTVAETLGFFLGQIAYMKSRGFEVHAVSSPGELLARCGRRETIETHPVRMERTISPRGDLRGLWQLWRLYLRDVTEAWLDRVLTAPSNRGGRRAA